MKWKPDNGQKYFSIMQVNGKCIVIEKIWTEHPLNSLDYAQGKCFKTEAEANHVKDVMDGEVKHKT